MQLARRNPRLGQTVCGLEGSQWSGRTRRVYGDISGFRIEPKTGVDPFPLAHGIGIACVLSDLLHSISDKLVGSFESQC